MPQVCEACSRRTMFEAVFIAEISLYLSGAGRSLSLEHNAEATVVIPHEAAAAQEMIRLDRELKRSWNPDDAGDIECRTVW